MHRCIRAGFGLALMGLMTLAGSTPLLMAAGPTVPTNCTATGHFITGPTLNRDPRWLDNYLNAVAAAGPGDVWAVGGYGSDVAEPGKNKYGSLIMHWTDSAWAPVPSPGSTAPRYLYSRLNGLAAIGPRDLWAVGAIGQNPPAPLIEHWDGRAWTVAPAPAGVADLELTQAAASGPADVWIAGSSARGVGRAFHWNGQTWQETPLPQPPNTSVHWRNLLAPASGDAWIVGYTQAMGTGEVRYDPLLAHWDGRAWTPVTIPGLPAGSSLNALAANGPQDVWVASTVTHQTTPPTPLPDPAWQTTFARWDGRQWHLVPAPDNYDILTLAFASPTDGWAGGLFTTRSRDYYALLHWDGTRWTPVAVRGADVPYESSPQAMNGLAVAGPDDVWAVGVGNLAGRPPRTRLTMVHIFRDCAVPTAGGPDPQNPAATYFPATGHSLSGPFHTYWAAHGGLAQFGYPITDEFQEKSTSDGKMYTVQYFERNRFELHPENAPPNDVLLGLLGRTMTTPPRLEQIYPLQPVRQVPPGTRFFPATGHSLAPEFRAYWEEHGALAVYGYPISQPFTETSLTDIKPYLVQYFERNRLELHPELPTESRVTLGLLGVDFLRSRGWLPNP